MIKTVGTEVLYIMAHLLITLGVLGAYIFTVHTGQSDETLKNLLLMIGGYWFAAIRNIGGKSGDQTATPTQAPTQNQTQPQQDQSTKQEGERI